MTPDFIVKSMRCSDPCNSLCSTYINRADSLSAGSVMNHTLLAFSIQQVKKITTDCVLSHIRKPMSFSFASLSPPLPPSKMSARNGSQRYTITARGYPA